MLACKNGREEAANTLITNGADVNLKKTVSVVIVIAMDLGLQQRNFLIIIIGWGEYTSHCLLCWI